MAKSHSGDQHRGERTDDRAHRRGTVPPEAVVPPPRDPRMVQPLQPDHLYKFGGLLFLFAVLYTFLDPIIHVALLIYAAAIVAIIFNAVLQALPGRRGWMTGLLGVVLLAAFGATLWFGIPVVIDQVRGLVGRIPEFSKLVENVEGWLRDVTGMNVNLVGSEVQSYLRNSLGGGEGGGGQLLSRAGGLLELLLIPLLIFFGALYAAGNPNEGLISPLLRAVPRDRRLAFRRMVQLLGDRLLGYVRGVLIAMVAVGVLSYIGYSIAGVPNALALALLAGLLEAIPLLGPWIGGSVAVAAGFLQSPTVGLYAAIVALIVQQLEGNLITPFAMSAAAEVHPFVTLFSLVLFGTLFGFLGVLLSVPIVLLFATIVEVLWVERAIDTDEDRIDPVVEG